ncbi:MAG: hypothetical protein FWG30_12115, partial [Eubacteriaceae bacterium]|nr:hypothetical protein [Eubacteriaceae bacterium]
GPIPQRTLPTTSEKIITRALNAHENSLDLNETAVNSLGARYFKVVGNESDASKKNFDSLGGNLIDTVASLKKSLQPPGIDYAVKAMQDKTLYIASSDGSDSFDGSSRERALKTIGEAKGLAKNGCSLRLLLYKYKTEGAGDPKALPPEYSPDISYAPGDRVSCQYTYECIAASSGAAPGLGSNAWRFVCIDEADDSAAVPAWSASAAYEAGDFASMETGSAYSPRLTFVCLCANTGAKPQASEAPTGFWCLIGAHNPILAIEGGLRLESLSGIAIDSAGQLVAALGSLSISECGFLDCASPVAAAGDFSLSRLSSASFQGPVYAASLSASYIGTVRFAMGAAAARDMYLGYNGQAAFGGSVSAGSCIELVSSGNVHFSGPVAVAQTDSPSRTAVSVSGGTIATFMLGISAFAYDSGTGNAAYGLLVESGSRVVLGLSSENIIAGFLAAIRVEVGATVHCNSALTVMQALNCNAGTVYGIYVGIAGSFVSSKSAEYIRENAPGYPLKQTVDKTEDGGAFIDLKSLSSEPEDEASDVADSGSGDATAYIGSNYSGIKIKTDIAGELSGIIRLEFKAWGYKQPYMMFDTIAECYVSSLSLDFDSFQQLNKGNALPPSIVYIDSENKWAIYLIDTPLLARIDATVTFLPIDKNPSDMSDSEYDRFALGLPNRVMNIESFDGIEESIGYVGDYYPVIDSGIQNTMQATDMAKTIYISTEDGDEKTFAFSRYSPYHSSKNLNVAMHGIPRNADINLVITRNKPLDHALKEYQPFYEYNVKQYYSNGDIVTFEGHVFEKIGAGSGIAPILGAETGWKHVNVEPPSRGVYSDYESYNPGDTVLYGNLTYVTVVYVSSIAPTSTDDHDYWRICGKYNPVVTGKFIITNQGNVTITNGYGNIEIIIVSDIVLSQNKWVTISAPVFALGALDVKYNGGLTCNGALKVTMVTTMQSGTVCFDKPVFVKGQITHASCSLVLYREAVIVEALSLYDSGIQASDNTRLALYGTVSLNASESYSRGSGIEANILSTISTYGIVTINGYERQIYATSGGTIENNSSAYILSKDSNVFSPLSAIKVDQGSKFIVCKGSQITRNGGITDSIDVNGVYFAYS